MTSRTPSLAQRLQRLVDESGESQAAIAFRAGVKPDAFNRILRELTSDPGWRTMVALLRDGFGVSLDKFEAGTVKKPAVSPYDRNGDYRMLIDLLESLRPERRKKAIAVFIWLASEMTDESDWKPAKESRADVEHTLRIGEEDGSVGSEHRSPSRSRHAPRKAR